MIIGKQNQYLREYLTESERSDHDEFNRLLAQLPHHHRPPVATCFVRVGSYKRGHSKPSSECKGLSHSFLRNYRNIFASQFCAINATNSTFVIGEINVKDTGGTVRAASNASLSPQDITTNNGFWSIAWVNAFPNQGLVVGSGTTTEDESDFALDTPIDNGSDPSELFYTAQVKPSDSWSSIDRQWTTEVKRHFWNRSGGNVTITEIGIEVRVGWRWSKVGANIIITRAEVLIIRDVLGSSVVVSDGEMGIATYTFVGPVFP